MFTGPGPSGGIEMSAAVRGRAGSVSEDVVASVVVGGASEIVSAGMGPGVGFDEPVGGGFAALGRRV